MTIAQNPADVGDLVVWPGRPRDNTYPWFVGVAHSVDEDGYVNMVNVRGRIRDAEEACNGRLWELIPLPILTSPEAINAALATTFASRDAVGAHLKPHLVEDYETITAGLYATRRALILRERTTPTLSMTEKESG